MLTVLLIACTLAGLFAGISLCLWNHILFLREINSFCDTERKLWTNKALVREGQARIFSDEQIAGQSSPELPEKPRSFSIRSPFQQGKLNLKTQVEETRRTEAGQNLPENIKAQIIERAEAMKTTK